MKTLKITGLDDTTRPEDLFSVVLGNLLIIKPDTVAELIQRGMTIDNTGIVGLSYQRMAKLVYLLLNADFISGLDPGLFMEYLGDYDFACRLLSVISKKDLQEALLKYLKVHDLWSTEFQDMLLAYYCKRQYSTLIDYAIDNQYVDILRYGSDLSSFGYGRIITMFPAEMIMTKIGGIIKNIMYNLDYKSLEEILAVISADDTISVQDTVPAFNAYFNVTDDISDGICVAYSNRFNYDARWAPSDKSDYETIKMIKIMVSHGAYDTTWNDYLKWDLPFCEQYLRPEMMGINHYLDQIIAARFKGPYSRLTAARSFCDLSIICIE